MLTFSTSAILLRRQDFGDHDVIATFMTSKLGKISVIAKNAKKSRKRFAGVLEPFSGLHMVCSTGRGLPVLREADLEAPFAGIREDIKKTAYAAYWAELLIRWLQEGHRQTALYDLFLHVLHALDGCPSTADSLAVESLSVLFQMRFMGLSGYSPNLEECAFCRRGIDQIKCNPIAFDLQKGALVCEKCLSRSSTVVALPERLQLTKGTIKQLVWLTHQDLDKALRVRFASSAVGEGLRFLNAFVPFYLGIEPRSLQFIRKLF